MGHSLRRAATMMAALLLSMAALAVGARAHEVRPAIMDVAVHGGLRAEVRLNAEALLAGIDLSVYGDTNAAPQAAEYDRLRALAPEDLAARFAEGFDDFAAGLRLEGAGTPRLVEVRTLPAEGGPEAPRETQLVFEADAEGPVAVGWTAAYGELILREVPRRGQDPDAAFAALLPIGGMSPPLGAGPPGGAAALIGALVAGVEHIVPKGLDHALFVLGLFFYALRLRPMLWQVAAFALAGAAALTLGAAGRVPVPAQVVEPLVALSLIWVGLQNALLRGSAGEQVPWGRVAAAFAFGLVHGLALGADFGEALGGRSFAPSLAGFVLGVEIGVLAVIAGAFALLGLPFGGRPWWRRAVAVPASLAIAALGAWWLIERTVLG